MKTELLPGSHDKEIIVRETVDMTATREYCREINNRGHAGWSPSREMKLAGTYPRNMVEKWAREDGIISTFMQLPKREFAAWLEKKARQHDCTDFIVSSEQSFRVNLSEPKAVPAKRKFIIPG